MFHYFIDLARKWGEKILNKEKVPLGARLIYWLGDILVYAPLKNRYGLSRIRVGYTAGEAIGPEIFTLLSLARHQSEAALRIRPKRRSTSPRSRTAKSMPTRSASRISASK